MIAPLRQTAPPPARRRLREAHQFVAETLLAKRRQEVPAAPPVPAWGAWTFATWVVVVTIVYFCAMLGWL